MESVWNYPRPPLVEQSAHRIRIEFDGVTIVDTSEAVRVLETSHPPVFYVPEKQIGAGVLEETDRRSFCEFKGLATYFDVRGPTRSTSHAAWTYREPSPGFEQLVGLIAFYPSRMDACFVGDELVQAQEGDFYGGWITDEITGPFKGGPGTGGW